LNVCARSRRHELVDSLDTSGSPLPLVLAVHNGRGYFLIAMSFWRRTGSFVRHAYAANVATMTAGLVLMGYQPPGNVHHHIL